jgi:hypothetical protein
MSREADGFQDETTGPPATPVAVGCHARSAQPLCSAETASAHRAAHVASSRSTGRTAQGAKLDRP